ncbi:MAG: hypothetical protein IPM69_03175 [Ignavibacteria bacterium]|nr:hypothetical protein [Ignavibacteria bacterium]
MKTTEYITVRIERLPKGYVFTCDDFRSEVNSREAIIKALNRMVVMGKIAKLSKGKYYKPETTVFGALPPNQNQIVKDLLESDGKPIGYLTGYSIYNQLGLSTQVSNIIQIGKNEIRPSFVREGFTISFIKQKNTITKENIPLLQVLDAIRSIKTIPDAPVGESCRRLMAIIRDIQAKPTLVRLALQYPPSTRALLGAMLEEIGSSPIAEPLKKSLNLITVYKLPGISSVLSTAATWNIK